MVGAFAFALLQELYQSQAIFGASRKHWQLWLGLFIVPFVALRRRACSACPERVLRRQRRGASA